MLKASGTLKKPLLFRGLCEWEINQTLKLVSVSSNNETAQTFRNGMSALT
jgi:hypothetical protein